MRLVTSIVVALIAVSAVALTPPCPCIVGVSPEYIHPAGGAMITLTGIDFRPPARVVITDLNSIEAIVVSVTPTQLQFVAPGINMNGRQAAGATIDVIFRARTAEEIRIRAVQYLTYMNVTLTPSIVWAEPARGSLLGGTRVTISGEGFQSPVRLFFGDTEAQVISVSYSQIIAIVPAGPRIGPVEIRLVNVNSETSAVARFPFRYVEPTRVTSITPSSGPASGGTRVRIEGSGFDVPISITIGGRVPLVLSVTSTEILALTMPLQTQPCRNLTGPVTVVNYGSGESATGLAFTYICTSRRRI